MRSASLRSTPSKLLELTGGGGGGPIKEIPAPYAQKNRDDFFWGGFYLYLPNLPLHILRNSGMFSSRKEPCYENHPAKRVT